MLRINELNGLYACSSLFMGGFQESATSDPIFTSLHGFKSAIHDWLDSNLILPREGQLEWMGKYAHIVAYTRSDQKRTERVLEQFGFISSEGVKQTKNRHDEYCTLWHMPVYKFLENLREIN